MQVKRIRDILQRDMGGAEGQGIAWLAIALVVGTLVRLYYVLSSDFPLNDGGMFYAMVRDLQHANYLLPATTSYNHAGIPFAYPPLAFYLAGLLNSLTPLSLLDVFRFLPATLSIGAIVAFYFLSRSMLSTRGAASLATLGFALLPRSTQWYIMGGGLTRALGLLFAILALRQIYLLYTSMDKKYVLGAVLFCAGAVLSHLGLAFLTAYSAALFFLFFGRNRAGIIHSVLVVLGTLIVSAPWWGSVLVQHGASPLLSALSAGSRDWPFLDRVVPLILLYLSYEPLTSILGSLALLGVLLCLRHKAILLPAWVLAVFLIDPRNSQGASPIPVGLLVGVGVADALLPLLRGEAGVHAPSLARLANKPAFADAGYVLNGLSKAVLAVALLSVVFSTLVGGQMLILGGLSEEERSAMEWVAANTPQDSAFVVATATDWATDKVSEWFPVLTDRVSVGTVQGYEWFKGAEFTQRLDRNTSLQKCAYSDASCLEEWAREAGLVFTHVYVPKPSAAALALGAQDGCAGIRYALSCDPRYRLIYDGPGAAVFARREAGG